MYMQDFGDDSDPMIFTGEKIRYQFDEYLLQSYDIIEINIKTTSPELNELFAVVTGGDGNNNMGMMGGGQGGGDIFFMNGYTLDDEGKVELPLIGELSLVGYTTKQAKELIEEEVKKYVNEDEFFVRVRLGGIRFSALGEFNVPGKLTVLQNRVTIFEAIAAAGDMNIIAKRNELVLVRQYPDGSQIHRINLNDKNILGSEYYFIRPNDVLYAEPLRVREVGTATNFIQTLTLITSTITAIAITATLVRN
ncbi:Polysaccharide export outer membrane protein [Indibacter alkaliphilus LW1]|jgi:polysaccharide export outer membrane protein|uniref:Polysaccharide export outer membrane protein n=1 Tax=Indibacter alkaliphilus (strain CCUG 57479 / KCTC 22604 / LW1) TaxID=1189612 RepID=S2D9V3_INDAL|nr:polysaccharide biosynthesis/export family protein [Indibacter alkaliphilus]EOZ95669.1 Polysaccharide export outer membrane protein [Indibacter alkaliphilus LW1]